MDGPGVGDAVVFFNTSLADEFAYRCKQAGQLASKMRYLTAPWVGLLEDGSWLANARRANAVFARLPDADIDALLADVRHAVEQSPEKRTQHFVFRRSTAR